MIRLQDIDNGAFVVSPDIVWYARVLLLFSASAMTDTGFKSFECALVSTLETFDDPENGNYINYIILWFIYIYIYIYIYILLINAFQASRNLSVRGSYTSSTTRHQFSMSFPLKVYQENCRLFLSVTPHSAKPAQSFSGSARRSPEGFRGRMQDVVCQLVGFGLVLRYGMNANGVQGIHASECNRDLAAPQFHRNWGAYNIIVF